MVNIFLAYSSKDFHYVEEVIGKLNLSQERFQLWYYHKNDAPNMTMEQILNKIASMDIFILLLSLNSVNSPSVQSEIKAAVNSTNMKEICIIVIDEIENLTQSMKELCQNNNIFLAKTSNQAAEIISESLTKYQEME